ncbi:MAG: hypothetical protein EHM58_13250 [Ignavibacteriae bacterium]|nr:MAG: hypothetical protein EHM58_13250 [Ignavibacteriota bacterium]
MIKKILFNVSFLILFTLLSCNLKSDLRYDENDNASILDKNETKTETLDNIEEILDGFNYQSVINRYKGNLDSDTKIIKFKYFVIFSNLENTLTLKLIDNDIRNTVKAMSNYYLSRFPDSVIAVFLFEDLDSYSNFSLKTFNLMKDDLSPYGFYKISKNVICIRYVSWKGSLPHEVTHSLIQADFPNIPSWFNEGLASMHENAKYNNGSLDAIFSWRILALRRAFQNNSYTGLRKLMETNDEELYSDRSSFYYAQARYLFMYFQQKGLLVDYYKSFRDTYDDDETGIIQIERLTGKSLEDIEPEFVKFVKNFD